MLQTTGQSQSFTVCVVSTSLTGNGTDCHLRVSHVLHHNTLVFLVNNKKSHTVHLHYLCNVGQIH